ncbi:MAG: tetratricopeptide repeat protein, partial [Candidatus Tectomicrobia bacterium]|nr:tetratricopeptide repeat protein [Candidatus Tectomicrobia bacterium]
LLIVGMVLMAEDIWALEPGDIFYLAYGKANVREEGNNSAKIIGKINMGDRLEFMEEQANWVKIKLPDGSSGWVYKNLVNPVQWDGEANLFYGNQLYYKGDIDEAIKQYRIAVAKKKDNWRAEYNLANAYLKKGMLPEAIEEYEKLNQKWPDKFDSYFNLGLAYYQQKTVDKAIQAWEKASTIDPNSLKVHYNLALVWESSDSSKAITYWKKYLDLATQYTETIKKTQEVTERIKALSEKTN